MATICAVTGCFEHDDLPSTLDKIRAAGYRHLETWQLEGWHQGQVNLLSPSSDGFPDHLLVDRYTKHLAQLCDQRDIRVTVVGAFNDFVQADDRDLDRQIEHVRTCIRIAVAFNAKIVRVMGGEPKHNVPLSACMDRIIAGYRAVIPDAVKAGVTLALENHGYITNHAPTVLQILDRVNSDALRCNLDASNFRWAGYPIPKIYEFYRLLAPYTVYAHFKNGHARQGFVKQYTATTLDAGELDLRYFVQTLAKAGFDGQWGIEYEGTDAPVQAHARNLNFATSLLREFGYEVESPAPAPAVQI